MFRLSPPPFQTEEFASDQPYNSEAVSKETVQSELNQLGVSREEEGAAEEAWEAELQADLEGLELGGEGEGLQAEDWEQELEQMLEMHSEKPTS